MPPPVEHEITFTQEEVDAAKATAFEPTIERLKELKRTELERARDEMWTGELIVNLPGKGSVPFKTDVQTQMDVFLLTQELKTPDTVLQGYKGADGNRRDLTKADFQKALQQGIQRKVQAFAIERAKLAELEAATTREDVQAITFTENT